MKNLVITDSVVSFINSAQNTLAKNVIIRVILDDINLNMLYSISINRTAI